MKIITLKTGFSNSYLIKDKGIILVDAGSYNSFNVFLRETKKNGINPKEISAVVITHCHWDHIGCAKSVKEYTNAKIIVHAAELDILENGKHLIVSSLTARGKIIEKILNIYNKNKQIEPCEADIIVNGEEKSLSEFGINGKIVFTPGHSSGSVSVILDSGEAFVGDMAINVSPWFANRLCLFLRKTLQLSKKVGKN
ncbi:MAG: hypothetical protein CSB55_08820 [Candidatus Cloacimonadota bacterium]|nr:MAG: hypothetical protein CSB55_08820 [Candidatus Cloacimonadota bacterium]